MDDPTDIEILDNVVNAPVVRVPGRAFPGVVVQGDTLSSLYHGARRIVERATAEGREDDDAELILDTLEGMLAIYERALDRHGLRLPYAGRVRSTDPDAGTG